MGIELDFQGDFSAVCQAEFGGRATDFVDREDIVMGKEVLGPSQGLFFQVFPLCFFFGFVIIFSGGDQVQCYMIGDPSFVSSYGIRQGGGFHPQGGECQVISGDTIQKPVSEMVAGLFGLLLDEGT